MNPFTHYKSSTFLDTLTRKRRSHPTLLRCKDRHKLNTLATTVKMGNMMARLNRNKLQQTSSGEQLGV